MTMDAKVCQLGDLLNPHLSNLNQILFTMHAGHHRVLSGRLHRQQPWILYLAHLHNDVIWMLSLLCLSMSARSEQWTVSRVPSQTQDTWSFEASKVIVCPLDKLPMSSARKWRRPLFSYWDTRTHNTHTC